MWMCCAQVCTILHCIEFYHSSPITKNQGTEKIQVCRYQTVLYTEDNLHTRLPVKQFLFSGGNF